MLSSRSSRRTARQTDAVAKTAKEFGQPGAKAVASLGGACQAMSGAEASLGGAKPGDAQGQQKQAVDEMRKARAELERERQRLAAEIEKLVKAQVMENLRAMLERQKSVREATQSLSSRGRVGRTAGGPARPAAFARRAARRRHRGADDSS